MDVLITMIVSFAIVFGLLAIAVITLLRWRRGQPISTWQWVATSFATVLWIAMFISLASNRRDDRAKLATSDPSAQRNSVVADGAGAKPPATIANAPKLLPVPPHHEPPPSAWTYEESSDAMHDNKGKIACTTSIDRVQLGWPYGSPTATLCVRRGPKFGLDAYVALSGDGQILCPLWDCIVHLRFDKRELQTFPAVRASDGSSNIIFITRTQRLVQELKKSTVTHVELEFYRAGVQVLTFKTSQFSWP